MPLLQEPQPHSRKDSNCLPAPAEVTGGTSVMNERNNTMLSTYCAIKLQIIFDQFSADCDALTARACRMHQLALPFSP